VELDRSQLIIIDLEASCWRKNPPDGQESEIIEIGICPFELATASPLHKRSLLVKPIRSKISDFCTKLTTLTQAQVDGGTSFDVACHTLRTEYHTERYAWASWGSYDLKMFRAQCEGFQVAYPFSECHIDLKTVYANLRTKGYRVGMSRAMRNEGVPLQGTHHRGHDDAWNTARLLQKLFGIHGNDLLELYLNP
jgi:inhibitor of KinA sporulation pathway (predicted exonuclease)